MKGPRAGREDAMAITYYKRFRMEIDLDGSLAPPRLPPPFRWISWEESLIDQHAEVKYLSFRTEIDAHGAVEVLSFKDCRLFGERRVAPLSPRPQEKWSSW